ncbi:MAG: Fe-S cluster assembly protein SufD [Rhodospirillaceae bacterium]|nr:Fe-S cluster assembly protein SufD [Rhodospirillaceae bacterium]
MTAVPTPLHGGDPHSDSLVLVETARPLMDAYRLARNTLPGARHPALMQARDRAMARFAQAGLPTRRDEAWKYTDLKRLAKLAPLMTAGDQPPPADLDDTLAVADESLHAMVFVDGRFRADLSFLGSLPDGVTVRPVSEVLEEAPDTLAALFEGDAAARDGLEWAALALMADGAFVELAESAELESPLRLVHLFSQRPAPVLAAPHLSVRAGANSAVTVVEHWAGPAAGDAVILPTQAIALGDGARVRLYRHQEGGDGALHLARGDVRVSRDTTFEAFALTTGGGLVRNEMRVAIDGPGVDVHLGGVYLGNGDRHIDTTTLVQHAAPDGVSRQVFRGVLDDRAHGVFQGRVGVARDAQRTDGHQLSNALLLSPKAEMDAKPELEIFADDVKCSHGATTGDIDHNALFYLRARGIDEAVARGLLIEAFIGEAMADITDEGVAEAFADAARSWWHAHTRTHTPAA